MITEDDVTEEQVNAGLMALLQCGSGDLECYEYEALSCYTNEVKRVYVAMFNAQNKGI
jgi:hypothetical protein